MKTTTRFTLPLLITGMLLSSAVAQTWTQLDLPVPTRQGLTPIGVFPTISSASTDPWTGTWTASVSPDWIGTFDGSGSNYPGSNANSGTSIWDFTGVGPSPGLANSYLPAGTLFGLGDLDKGSSKLETITLQARDASGFIITTQWLRLGSVAFVAGSISDRTQASMPRWSWDSTDSTYTFDGTQVPGNPTIYVQLESSVEIGSLNVGKPEVPSNFDLAAPVVPEPSSMILVALGLAGTAFMVRLRANPASRV